MGTEVIKSDCILCINSCGINAYVEDGKLVKVEGMKALVTALGDVQAEKFISLLLRSPFDYTKWQKKLWIDRNITDISNEAMKLRVTEK